MNQLPIATSDETPEKCAVCGRELPRSDLFPAALIRGPLAETIRQSLPGWSNKGYICQTDLARFRGEHVERILEREIGELSELEQSVVRSLKEQEFVADGIGEPTGMTFGERLADRVAETGGSWRFIIGFGVTLLAWVALNSHWLTYAPFDPYPFIFLNLLLSCLAAIQAPIIMMSQNRQEAKDRERARNDYKVNLKAELEIRHLHEKIDHLLSTQWQRLVDIQQQQMALLEVLASDRHESNHKTHT